jgi:flagellar hook protein FlgE
VTRDKKYKLLGRAVSTKGIYSDALSAVDVSNISLAPRATTVVNYSLNLNANDPVRSTLFNFIGESFDTAAASSDFNVSTIIYDSLGNSILTKTFFRHTGVNKWSYHVLKAIANTPDNRIEIQEEGVLTFDATGRLLEQQRDPSSASKQEIQFSFGASNRLAQTTQYSSNASTVTSISQNGYAQGSLMSVSFDNRGNMFGNFSNEKSRQLYNLPLARFMGEDFLDEVSPGIFAANDDSGDASLCSSRDGGEFLISAE